MRLRVTTLAAALATLATLAACADAPTAPSPSPSRLANSGARGAIGINVLLASAPGGAELAALRQIGTVFDVLPEIHAVIMRGGAEDLPAIRALPFVTSAEPDAELWPIPEELQGVTDFTDGLSMWNLDAVNVTAGPGPDQRVVPFTGEGVYVGVLDTGLLPSWRQYFPTARIAEEFATTFIGGGALDQGNTPSPPGKWERDTQAHGTHVTSTILGFNFGGTFVTGVAPEATVIPVKVLNQNGSGWWSAIAQGILHLARLEAGPLAGHPMVINMSLGGGSLPPIAKAALDFAIGQGVIVVASAGNAGAAGMGYPGAYPPVISAAAIGWVDQWTTGPWWFALDVPDPTDPNEFFVASFSSRALAGQDLDVAAPGVAVVGPFQTNQGQLSFFFLTGTSMSSPHVAGIVALMAEQNPALTAAQAEQILESTAVPLPPGCRAVLAGPGGPTVNQCWQANATGAGIVQADAATNEAP
ncbi:MAG TPA: S8 family serine peptidase [Gemmatimonadaceae bacterium]|nr:S8 family serine peptidase [Gemmatimonadaceae bacterium]